MSISVLAAHALVQRIVLDGAQTDAGRVVNSGDPTFGG
jgi:hypothetical protein